VALSSEVLTVKELANYLKIHESTVYRLIKTRQLPAFKVGRDWRFNREQIDRWRLERTVKPDPQAREFPPVT
jgi:excisionase family DNA binding protein